MYCRLIAATALVLGPVTGALAEPSRADVEAILPAFESYVMETMEAWQTPGLAIAVVLGEETIYKRGFGVRDLESGEPVDPDTLFPIGSTTKAFASVSLAQAVDDGLLDWNDRVIDHWPSFQLADPWVSREFRIDDLMAQRSGLPHYAVTGLAGFGYDTETLISALRFIDPVSSFRSTYAYQNGFFLLGGEIVAGLHGMADWNAYAGKRILEPLGMSDTIFERGRFLDAANRVSPHADLDDGWKPIPVARFHEALGAAGNMYSNVSDMGRWVAMQVNGGAYKGTRVVSAQNLQHTHRRHVTMGRGASYALGWVVMDRSPHPLIWHNGQIAGIHNMVAIMPKERLGIVILVNQGPSMPEPLAFRFFDLVFGQPPQAYAEEARARLQAPAEPAAAAPDVLRAELAEDYAGRYDHPVLGTLTVSHDSEGLTLRMGPRAFAAALVLKEGETFRVLWKGWKAELGEEEGGFVSFDRDPWRGVTAISLYQEGNKITSFERMPE